MPDRDPPEAAPLIIAATRWIPIGIILAAWALGIDGSRAVLAQSAVNHQALGTAERLIIVDDDTAMFKAMVARQGVYAMPWLPLTDPDGGLEMIYLLREPTVRLLGITCAMGCSTTEVCMASIKRILELTGRTDVSLSRGANSPQELGIPTEASRFIIDTVMRHPGQVEIIATAPLTNIATAMMLEPRLPQNWKMLHLATGEFWGTLGHWSDGSELSWLTGYKDLNINVDVPAIRYVLEHAAANMRVYPNEIMDAAFLTRADLRALEQADTPLATWVASETWLMTAIEGLVMKGLALHGLIGAAVALDPAVAEPPLKLGIRLKHMGRNGYIFETSNDPGVAVYPVYANVREPARIEERLVERCK